MRIDVVVSKAEFIDKGWLKEMRLADCHTPVGIVLIAGSKPATIEIAIERTRRQGRLIFIAEASEQTVLGGEVVVDANIKVVLVCAFLGISEIVVPAVIVIGSRIESRERLCHWIDCARTTARKYVRRRARTVCRDGNTTVARSIVRGDLRES